MAQEVSYTLLLNDGLLDSLRRLYACQTIDSPTPYITTYIQGKGYTISVYSKKKDGYTRVLFQGKNAEEEAKYWLKKGAEEKEGKLEVPAQRKKIASNTVSKFPQIGSDEVGTGDYFGPVIVAAAYVEEKDLPLLRELGVTDSKKMDDEKIRQIGPTLVSTFPYSQLCLDNKKYNEVHAKGININAMKAKMHNRALGNLAKKYPRAYRYMDQFAAEGLYYSYLRDEPEVLKDIVFATKGELHFASVALASVIARYSFLLHMDQLSESVGASLPYGAGEKVVCFAKRFLKKHTVEELDSISKADFATRKKVLE